MSGEWPKRKEDVSRRPWQKDFKEFAERSSSTETPSGRPQYVTSTPTRDRSDIDIGVMNTPSRSSDISGLSVNFTDDATNRDQHDLCQRLNDLSLSPRDATFSKEAPVPYDNNNYTNNSQYSVEYSACLKPWADNNYTNNSQYSVKYPPGLEPCADIFHRVEQPARVPLYKRKSVLQPITESPQTMPAVENPQTMWSNGKNAHLPAEDATMMATLSLLRKQVQLNKSSVTSCLEYSYACKSEGNAASSYTASVDVPLEPVYLLEKLPETAAPNVAELCCSGRAMPLQGYVLRQGPTPVYALQNVQLYELRPLNNTHYVNVPESNTVLGRPMVDQSIASTRTLYANYSQPYQVAAVSPVTTPAAASIQNYNSIPGFIHQTAKSESMPKFPMPATGATTQLSSRNHMFTELPQKLYPESSLYANRTQTYTTGGTLRSTKDANGTATAACLAYQAPANKSYLAASLNNLSNTTKTAVSSRTANMSEISLPSTSKHDAKFFPVVGVDDSINKKLPSLNNLSNTTKTSLSGTPSRPMSEITLPSTSENHSHFFPDVDVDDIINKKLASLNNPSNTTTPALSGTLNTSEIGSPSTSGHDPFFFPFVFADDTVNKKPPIPALMSLDLKKRPTTVFHKTYCKFCKDIKEPSYKNHTVKDKKGNVICPILFKHACSLCGATGKQAHTESHCLKNLDKGVLSFKERPW